MSLMCAADLNKRILVEGVDVPYRDKEWEWKTILDFGSVFRVFRFNVRWADGSVTWTDALNFIDFRSEVVDMIKRQAVKYPSRPLGLIDHYHLRTAFNIAIHDYFPGFKKRAAQPDNTADRTSVKPVYTLRQQKFLTPTAQRYWTADAANTRLDQNIKMIEREERERKLKINDLYRSPRVSVDTVLDPSVLLTPKVHARQARGTQLFRDTPKKNNVDDGAHDGK